MRKNSQIENFIIDLLFKIGDNRLKLTMHSICLPPVTKTNYYFVI